MNGAEHYERAEALLDSCQTQSDMDDADRIVEYYPDHDEGRCVEYALAAAQVHATLALFHHLREIGDQLDRRRARSVTGGIDHHTSNVQAAAADMRRNPSLSDMSAADAERPGPEDY